MKKAVLFKFSKPRKKQKQQETRSSCSTEHYEVMKLCTGLVKDSNGWYLAVLGQDEAVIDAIGSVEGIDGFMY